MAIECTKEGVKFAAQGDIGSGSVTLRSHTDVDKPDQSVAIELSEPVHLTFSLKYLENFCKASGLSGQVKVSLSAEVPLLVEYTLANNSYLRFYLAPKVKLAFSRVCDVRVLTFNRSVMRSRLSAGVVIGYRRKMAWATGAVRFNAQKGYSSGLDTRKYQCFQAIISKSLSLKK